MKTAYQAVHLFSPLEDSRWDSFVERHPDSSVFHTSGWVNALRLTYGYVPYAMSTSAPGDPLENAWLFCAINSRLTGCRWVSLPFSDHCEPLTGCSTDLAPFVSLFGLMMRQRSRLRYFETRPLHPLEENIRCYQMRAVVASTRPYCFHSVDLTPDLEKLFRNCHKNCTQRKIQRSEREGLRYEAGQSNHLLEAFYDLHTMTRRRHGAPPQPKSWFQNIIRSLGGPCAIRVAYKDALPIAAIITIRHKDSIVYKYGCSDPAYHNMGRMPLLFWKTIEEAKRQGLRVFDLGRSDLWNAGLIRFKDRWGSRRWIAPYVRFTSGTAPRNSYESLWPEDRARLSRDLFRYMPDFVARAAGEMFYRHIG